MEIEICEEFFYRVKNKNLDIFKTFNTSTENILRNNENIKLYDGEWIKIKVNDYVVHHVKPTESLTQIAKIYCIDEEKIIKDNELKNNKLFIGQRLKIYKKKSTNA
ncbi:MAG: LysM peptidoglycan-binding domain-containing protein [Clostridia bacterium]|nr:LysM peptidoglycan-binding domain-containing protein [Clostridia bacterium]